ncbi:hypothetical protein B0O99DRAFT_598918 [Bisporella sp. PMI_857]|nr:hypothetical protein B0O99DRAFT_598918 [Bisporella sp. PMI_857]
MPNQQISQSLNHSVLLTVMLLSIFVFGLRGFARLKSRVPLYVSGDSASEISFVIMCCLFIAAMPTLYAVVSGDPISNESLSDALPNMLYLLRGGVIFFWLALWIVKISLLALLKKITFGVTKYENSRRFIMLLTVVTFVGCIIADLASFLSFRTWFTYNKPACIYKNVEYVLGRRREAHYGGDSVRECLNLRDAISHPVSLWFSAAADITTNLLILALFVHLFRHRRASMREKIGFGIISTIGITTMIIAVVRVVPSDDALDGRVSTQYLIFWAAIEGFFAMLVQCLPDFTYLTQSRGQVSHTRQSSATLLDYPHSATPACSNRQFDDGQPSRDSSPTYTENISLEEIDIVDYAPGEKTEHREQRPLSMV